MNTLPTFLAQALTAAALCTVLGSGLALAAAAAGVNGGNTSGSAAGFGYPGANGQPGDSGRSVNNRTSPRSINDRTEPRQSGDSATEPSPARGSSDSLQQERQQGGEEMIRERTGQQP